MGGLSNQFSLHHPDFRPRNPDRHHSDVLHWVNSPKGFAVVTAKTKRGYKMMTGVYFWIACGAIPCLHKTLGRNSLCTIIETMDSDLIRTSLPLRSDTELPPGELQPIVLPGLPKVITPKCSYRHNRMTIACFMFVVSMGTTLRSLTDLQQLPRSMSRAPEPNKEGPG